MKIAIVLSTLLSTFGTVPNLCDDVFLDAWGEPLTDDVGQTLSRYCAWTGPDAPIWDADVCCSIDDDADDADCSAPKSGICPKGTQRRYCEHGAADSLGRVTCYQPFPSGCEAGMCVEAPEFPPPVTKSDFVMCCSPGGACQYVTVDNGLDCQGELLSCDYGYVDTDGYIECWD